MPTLNTIHMRTYSSGLHLCPNDLVYFAAPASSGNGDDSSKPSSSSDAEANLIDDAAGSSPQAVMQVRGGHVCCRKLRLATHRYH
jgi:hypothetical protein